MNAVLIFLLSALAALALFAGGAALALPDRTFNRRLTRLSAEPAAAARRLSDYAPALLRTLVRWGEAAGRGGLENEARAALRLRLVQAGFYSDRAAEAFFGVRALAALALGVFAALLAALLGWGGPLGVLLALMVGANLGLLLPKILLSQRIAERGRAMYLGLPDAIDLMVVSLEAGATLSVALQRVEVEFRQLHPVVSEQFAIVLAEMKAGATRAEALHRLALRSPAEEIKSLAIMVVQSEAVGASLGDTLRIFSEEMRQTRYLDAERKAAELPVKLAFPLVLFIFPCLCGVIFIPIAIRVLRGLMT